MKTITKKEIKELILESFDILSEQKVRASMPKLVPAKLVVSNAACHAAYPENPEKCVGTAGAGDGHGGGDGDGKHLNQSDDAWTRALRRIDQKNKEKRQRRSKGKKEPVRARKKDSTSREDGLDPQDTPEVQPWSKTEPLEPPPVRPKKLPDEPKDKKPKLKKVEKKKPTGQNITFKGSYNKQLQASEFKLKLTDVYDDTSSSDNNPEVLIFKLPRNPGYLHTFSEIFDVEIPAKGKDGITRYGAKKNLNHLVNSWGSFLEENLKVKSGSLIKSDVATGRLQTDKQKIAYLIWLVFKGYLINNGKTFLEEYNHGVLRRPNLKTQVSPGFEMIQWSELVGEEQLSQAIDRAIAVMEIQHPELALLDQTRGLQARDSETRDPRLGPENNK